MKIEKLIKKCDLKTNSKDIKKGDIFFCALGGYDKNKYIPDAIKKGCRLVITDKDIKDKVKYLKHDNLSLYLKELLDLKYQFPLKNKKLIGVTGTDGKTTTVTIIRDMLDGASIGTNGVEFNDYHKEIRNTTPSLDELYKYFDIINQKKLDNIVMEVSSESYLTERIPELKFDIGIFLNISNEHLDKHKSFLNYLECKKKLLLNSKIKIINRDSRYFNYLKDGLQNYLTFGYKKGDLKVLKYQLFFNKTTIWFKYQKKKYKIDSPLTGKYNIDNLMASILCLIALGYKIDDIIKRIKLIKTIPGRMELLNIKNYHVLIDYAHTEHATKEVFRFVKKFQKNIITVLGCAGGRYKEKRPLIGKYACKYSKTVIFTSDDPRNENPSEIIKEMLSQTKKKNYYIIINRKEAIKTALNIAKKNDLILILGKGRDNYMAILDKKIPYSDIDVIKEFVKIV